MANQILKFTEGQKAMFVNVDGTEYIALQDIDSCNVDESISNDVAGFEAAGNVLMLVDTSVSDSFGCEFEWYKYEGYITEIEFSTNSELVGTRPVGR